MISNVEMRSKSEEMLEDACKTIAIVSRMSQLEPETTGMTIEEVNDYIKHASEKLTTKYEDMSLKRMLVELVLDISEIWEIGGHEDGKKDC